eukprot:461402-Rhodomonas_salina.3
MTDFLCAWGGFIPCEGDGTTFHPFVSMRSRFSELVCIEIPYRSGLFASDRVAIADDEFENVGRALKGYQSTEAPHSSPYKLSFDRQSGRLTVAWKGGGGGEKGKGRASGEEVVSIALEEQPNRAVSLPLPEPSFLVLAVGLIPFVSFASSVLARTLFLPSLLRLLPLPC